MKRLLIQDSGTEEEVERLLREKANALFKASAVGELVSLRDFMDGYHLVFTLSTM